MIKRFRGFGVCYLVGVLIYYVKGVIEYCFYFIDFVFVLLSNLCDLML